MIKPAPDPDDDQPPEPHAWDSVTSEDGTKITYAVYGEGPGIVIVPGVFGLGADYPCLAQYLVEDGFTVYGVNRRGRPGSGPQRPDHAVHGIQAECADLAAVLGKTGAHLVFGHGTGGVVALQTTRRHPVAVTRLAVHEPPVSVRGSVPDGFLPEYERLLAEGRVGEALLLMAKPLGMLPPAMRRVPLGPLRWFLRKTDQPETSQDELDVLATFPAEHRMITGLSQHAHRYREFTTKTLITVGDRAPRYLTKAGRYLAEVMPDARLVTMSGIDVENLDDHPEAIAEELTAFFTAEQAPWPG